MPEILTRDRTRGRSDLLKSAITPISREHSHGDGRGAGSRAPVVVRCAFARSESWSQSVLDNDHDSDLAHRLWVHFGEGSIAGEHSGMKTPSPLPPSLVGTAFLTTDDTGLSRSRLRRSDLQRPFRGVRSIGLDPQMNVRERCLMYAPRMPPGHAFTHVTAAQLYRIPLPPRWENSTQLHVAVNEHSEPPDVLGVRGHRFEGLDARIRSFRGFRVTDPATTWCHLGAILSPYDLVAAGDFLISGRVTNTGREAALSTMDELAKAARKFWGQRGVRNVRAALDRVRTDVDSRPETWTRLLLVDAGLPEPIVNLPIFSAAGERLGKPDLVYPWARTLLEYEGDEHRVSKVRFRRDIARRERFEANGWRVIRVIPDDVFIDPGTFVARVRRILMQQNLARSESWSF